MIEGFDKEIDTLLRQTAKSETAPANNLKSAIKYSKSQIHLDADEISAFAENALPEKTKLEYTAHFADCDRCRAILSNLIALNAEVETDSSGIKREIAATSIPWHRKLFAFPQLAYTLGALIVLFGGFFAFLVVRNMDEATGSADVSQISENQPRAGGPSFEDEQAVSAPNAMSNMATSANTTSANTTSNAMLSNSASVYGGNTATISNNAGSRAANTNSVAAQPIELSPKPADLPETARVAPQAPTETYSTDAAGSSAARVSESEKKAAEKRTDAEKTEIQQAAPRSDSSALSARNTTPTTNESDSPKEKSLKKRATVAENRQINGKTFTRKEGVWYDASYNGQTTTNVSRGSEDYKKLDSGLRSTVENLGGTIVIVWKNKAYRIQ